MTPREMAERALALAEGATPGPWRDDDERRGQWAIIGADDEVVTLTPCIAVGDARFIAESRTLLPALARAVLVAEARAEYWRLRTSVYDVTHGVPCDVSKHDLCKAVSAAEASLRALGVPEEEW